MTRQITLGGLDPLDNLAGGLELPTISTLPAMAAVAEALDDAVTRRTGVLVVGEKGVGKSYALRRVVADFEQAERDRQDVDDGYQRRRLLPVHGLYSPRYRDALLYLLRLVTGEDVRPRVHGAPVTEDALIERLYLHSLDDNVVALVVDEAERLSPAALMLLRDVMAKAVAHDPSQAVTTDSRALGLGVVLVGATPARAMVAATVEQGHRWARTITVDAVQPEAVGAIYEAWFPGFRGEIARRPAAWWQSVVDGHVTLGQSVAVRSLDHHARLYWRYVLRTLDGITARDEVPLDMDLFKYAAEQTPWQRGVPHRPLHDGA